MLSWYAVASAIDTARAGNPRLTPMAAISAAFSPCSVVSSTRCAASSAEQPSGSGSGPDPRHSATPVPITTASTTSRTRDLFISAWLSLRQLACSAALRLMPSPDHGWASTAPETELRRKRTLSAPERSAALITFGLESMSRMVTLVPAVT